MAAAAENSIEMTPNTIKARFSQDIRNNYISRLPEGEGRDRLRGFIIEINGPEDAVDARTSIELMTRIHQIYFNEIWNENDMALNAPEHVPDNDEVFANVYGYTKGGIRIINNDTNREIIVNSYYNIGGTAPKGKIESSDIVRSANGAINIVATLFNTGRRELGEETGITPRIFDELNNMPPSGDRNRVGNTLYFIYYVNNNEYDRLVQQMIRYQDDVHGRSSDVRSIHYKKYLKYKAKYLQLVAQLRK